LNANQQEGYRRLEHIIDVTDIRLSRRGELSIFQGQRYGHDYFAAKNDQNAAKLSQWLEDRSIAVAQSSQCVSLFL